MDKLLFLILLSYFGLKPISSIELIDIEGRDLIGDKITEWGWDDSYVRIAFNEEIKDPLVIARITCKDCEGDNKPKINSNVETNVLKLDLSNGKTHDNGYEWSLYVNGKIDYETMNHSYEFEMNFQNTVTFLIAINNIDDNPPIITTNNRDCTVKETPIGVGETKCKYNVTDPDGNKFIKTINFDFTKVSSDDVIKKFNFTKIILKNPDEINKELDQYIEVTLVVQEALDFETVPLYFFNLRAIDSGKNQFEYPVIVNVEDVPDTPPKWIKIFASQKFYEEGVENFEVKAIDGDTHINPTSTIEYKIDFTATDKQLKEKISIDENGKIIVNKIDRDTLDKSLGDTLEFKLTATEVLPSCKFPPDVLSCPGHNDEDLTEEICVECKGTWINMNTDTTATFIILDINDNKAQVDKLKDIVIPENRTLIYNEEKLTINDIDLGINAKCDIKLIEKCDLDSNDAEKMEDAFQLIPSSGFEEWESQISVIETTLDYEIPEMRKIKLFVHTEDFQMNETCDTEINIIVENRNDEIPVFYDCDSNEQKINFDFSQNELVGKGTEIGRVCAFDKDIDDWMTFDFVASSTEESFEIEPFEKKGMIIKTKKEKTFDFETMPQVVINVKATDNLITKYDKLLHTEFATVTVDVIEVNYKPPRIQLNGGITQVMENIKPETIIAGKEGESPHVITATDPNTSANLTFSIVWDDTWATKQGQKADLKDFKGCLVIETYSNNPGNPSDTRKVYGRLVVKQIGIDKNGNIITIDYEKFEFLYLKIRVNDNDQHIGQTFDEVTISIPIGDENDNPPIFDMSTVNAVRSVTETDNTAYTTIGTIIATDADGPEYNTVYYYVRPLNENAIYQNVININETTGELYMDKGNCVDADKRCKEVLLYEVRATDIDHNTTAKFSINIIDTNNKYPYWTNENTSIKPVFENVTQESLITLKAHDDDCEELFRTVVFMLNDPSLAKIFKVNKIGGEVTVSCEDHSKKCLDRDGTDGTNGHDFYTVAIQLQDMNGTGDFKKTDISFVVPVKDVNDNAPILQNVELNSIKENADIDSYVGKIIAKDIDEPNTPNSEIEYSIMKVYQKNNEDSEDVDIDKDLLKINSITGVLNTNKSFRNYFGTIIIQIYTRDHGNPQQHDNKNYTLEVAKYNFEKPTFLFPLNNSEITLSTKQIPFRKLSTGDNKPLNYINSTDNQNEKYRIQFKIISENSASSNFLFEIHPINLPDSNIADLWMTRSLSENDPTEYEVVLEASHDGVGEENKAEIKTLIKFVNPDAEPYFQIEEKQCKFHETFTNETCDIAPAFDPTGKPNIYYYLYKTDNKMFNVVKDPENGEGTKLNVLVGLDIEDHPNYTVYIRAANTISNPPYEPENPKSILTVSVTLIDINNHPPVFTQDLWVVGLSDQDEPNKQPIISLNATDVDEVDQGKLKYAIVGGTLKVSNDDLLSIKDPFKVEENGDIYNNFKPTDGMKGYFTFQVSVTDTPPESHVVKSTVNVSIISEAIRTSFIFNNTEHDVRNKRTDIEEIFQKVFGYKCILDSTSQATDDSGSVIPGQVRAKFHFMNDKDEPIDKDEIIRKSNDLNNIALLRIEFEKIGLNYMSKNSNNDNDSDDKGEDFQKLKIIFIVVTVILSSGCIILVIAFVLKVRSLSQRLDKMNVPMFGSRNSGLNRIGVNAPGTNKHAIEANPVYHTDIKPNFDTVSQGSGDSDLIGIEDNADFDDYSDKKKIMDEEKNYKPTLNPLASAPHVNDLNDVSI